jgi:hypothetical protein
LPDYNLRTKSLSSDEDENYLDPRIVLTITSVLEAFRQQTLSQSYVTIWPSDYNLRTRSLSSEVTSHKNLMQVSLTITSVLEAFRQSGKGTPGKSVHNFRLCWRGVVSSSFKKSSLVLRLLWVDCSTCCLTKDPQLEIA